MRRAMPMMPQEEARGAHIAVSRYTTTVPLMTVRVRFAPSPTGSLPLGNALTGVANRTFADERGGVLVLRIDDTDAARNVDAGPILHDLEWVGLRFDEGPLR